MPNRRLNPTLLATALLMLLSACSTTAISPQAEDLAAPGEWARGGNDSLVSEDWVQDFSDAQLAQFVAEAFDRNYSLNQERARLDSARQSVVVAGADRWPSVDLALDGSRRSVDDSTGSSQVTDSYSISADLGWTVDIWGRLSKQQQAAQLGFAAQRARLQSVERSIAATTAGRYFDVLAQRQLLEVAKRRLDNAIESHDIVASGYRQGLNDALDLYLARNQRERQQANYSLQEQTYIEAIADLQLALARYPDGQLALEQDLPVLSDPIPVGLPSGLLTRRPDIQEAWLNLLAADADLAAAHKARFPRLSLVGSTGQTADEFSELLDNGASAWNLAFGLTQPLFDAGRLKALEEQAVSRLQIAEQQYLELVFQAFADVENAISRSASLADRYESLLAAEQNSRAALELALEQYQRGLVTYTTVLESQQQAFDAETTVVQLRNQRLQNRISLYLALGGEFTTGE